MAIRGHIEPLPNSTIIQRSLATVTWQLFASPDYLAKTGTPQSPYDLFKRKCLKVGWQPPSGHWALERDNGLKAIVPNQPQLCSDDMGTVKKAVIEGLGIVSLPNCVCRNEIKNGTLHRVLPN